MLHTEGLVQEGSNSIVLAMELLQSCTKPSIYSSIGNEKYHSVVHHRNTPFPMEYTVKSLI